MDKGQKIILPAWHVALGLEEIRGPDPRTLLLLCPADLELVQMPLIQGLVHKIHLHWEAATPSDHGQVFPCCKSPG